jgi:hypothetical protein
MPALDVLASVLQALRMRWCLRQLTLPAFEQLLVKRET